MTADEGRIIADEYRRARDAFTLASRRLTAASRAYHALPLLFDDETAAEMAAGDGVTL